jgi:hypothetical protein
MQEIENLGAVLAEQNDEWIEACRDIGPEILAASQKAAGKADINDETSGTIEAIGA